MGMFAFPGTRFSAVCKDTMFSSLPTSGGELRSWEERDEVEERTWEGN